MNALYIIGPLNRWNHLQCANPYFGE